MKEIVFDLETRSMVDLPARGAWVYGMDPSTDILVLAWRCGEESGLWSPCPPFDGVTKDVPPVFSDPGAVYIAHNASFEIALTVGVLIKRYGFPAQMGELHRWYCTAGMCRALGLPGSLDDASKALGIGGKKGDGGGLIKKYSLPVKDKMGDMVFRDFLREDWVAMCEYNRQDVELTSTLYHRFKDNPTVKAEREVFLHDLMINARGVRVDLDALGRVEAVIAAMDTRAAAEAAKYGINTNSGPQIKEFLLRRGVKVKTATAEELDKVTSGDADVRTVLELRKYQSRASLKKYAALREYMTGDRLRYSFLYFGATTGRFAGKGVQLHNLIKTGTDPDQIEEDLRGLSADMGYRDFTTAAQRILPGLLIPDEGQSFIMGDFNAIEARVAAYVAGAQTLTDIFARGEDPYKHMAAVIYRKTPGEVQPKERQVGKQAVLGCTYGLGKVKFKETAGRFGMKITDAEAEGAVRAYRATHHQIPKLWGDLERAFRWCHAKKVEVKIGEHLRVKGAGSSVCITLPSGRALWYHGIIDLDREGISFMSYKTKTDTVIWGGVLVENVVQAIARDIMVDRMLMCERNGLPVTLHVHDEVVCQGGEDKKDMYDYIMNTSPDWLPGFPLKTESVVSRRYYK